MKRIIDMLLKMIWPAIVSFILLVAEIFVSETRFFTLHKYAEGESVFETSILIGDEFTAPLIWLTIFAVAIFAAMFIAGLVWNVVYSIKHKDEE